MPTTNSETGRFNNQLLVDLYKTRFKAIAYKMSAYEDIEGAKLIASETFHTMYEMCAKGQIHFETPAQGWSYWLKSATHAAQREYDEKTVRLGDQQHAHLLSKEDLEHASTEDYSIISREVMEMLSDIPSIYRDVLIYRFYQGLNSKEIAILMNIKAPAVRQRQKRGMEMLRQKLKDNPDKQMMLGDFLYLMLILAAFHHSQEINLPESVTNRPFFPFSNIETTSRENEQA